VRFRSGGWQFRPREILGTVKNSRHFSASNHETGVDIGYRGGAAQCHGKIQLIPEDLQHMAGSHFSTDCYAPQDGTPLRHGPCPQGEGREHIRAAANTAIDERLRFAAHDGHLWSAKM
jgi:hypothetical protein